MFIFVLNFLQSDAFLPKNVTLNTYLGVISKPLAKKTFKDIQRYIFTNITIKYLIKLI